MQTCVGAGALTCPQNFSGKPLLKKLFVYFLDVKCFFDSTGHIVANHQLCKLGSVYQDNSLAQSLCGFDGRARKSRGSPE